MAAPKEKGRMQILQFDEQWPMAAFVKDAIINKHIKKRVPHEKAMANTILQTWMVNTCSNSQLPRYIADMLQVAKELNIRVNMQMPAQQVWRQVPIWHHFAFKGPVKFWCSSKTFQCQMDNHGIEMAGKVEVMAARVTL
ncbi:hypothetical protein IW262DRAFT_1416278 [Armillaria fumosa]|nr:hypothetical protein IW262DRAFT_1416278 [Armillaria fumosa]